jgi:cytoskeletal protein RodZ
MHRIAVLLIVFALALAETACQRNDTTTGADTEPPSEPEVSEPAGTVDATPPPPSATAEPEGPQFAPEGVFFLVAAKSIETADGIVGFPAGTEVRKQEDGTFLAGRQPLGLRPDEVTNDLRVVRRIAALNQAAQTARAAQLAAQEKARHEAAERAKKAAASKAKAQASAVAAATPAPPKPLGSVMDRPTQRVKDGYYWKRNAAGEWEVDRPVRN